MTFASNFRDAAPMGMQVRGYVLTKAIAQGGEGIVYEAIHAEHGAVLVKEFWPKQIVSRARSAYAQAAQKAWQADYRRGIERFISLGERLGALPSHPGVMTTIEVFPEHNTAYLTMAKVAGRSLDEALKDGAFADGADIERLAGKLAAAMAHIHANGLLHRDIAPDNIIVTPGREWDAVLIDFNAAKDIVLRVSRSQEGIVKPGYTPIEQSDPEGLEPVGPWTDVYSASAVLYRCIVGKPPVDPAIRLLRPDQDKPLRQRFAGKLPEGLLAAIDLGLQPRSDDRPHSAEEWQRILGGEIPKPKRKKKAPSAAAPVSVARTDPPPDDVAPEQPVEVNAVHSLFDDRANEVAAPTRPNPLARNKVLLPLAAAALVLVPGIQFLLKNEVEGTGTTAEATETPPAVNPPRARPMGQGVEEIKPGLWLERGGARGDNPVRDGDMVSVSIKFLDTNGTVFNSGLRNEVLVAGQFPFGSGLLDKLAYGDSAKVYFDLALLKDSDPTLAGKLLTTLNLQIDSAIQAELTIDRCVAPETAAIGGGSVRTPCLAGKWNVSFVDAGNKKFFGTFHVADNAVSSGIVKIHLDNDGATYTVIQNCSFYVRNDINLNCVVVKDEVGTGYQADKFVLRHTQPGRLTGYGGGEAPVTDVVFADID